MDTHNKGRLHRILSSSYLFYLVLFFVGISFDLIFPTHFFENIYTVSLGFILIILASLLILWVKSNSKKPKKEILTKEDFMHGPYKYTSIPNHWGIFILMLGFGIMINAVFMIIFTIISFLFTLPVFLKMQENVLAEKFGVPYLEYRKTVKF
jgi:protein-S-isoprenylcysteine O-methyltransferase Ste14